MHKDRRFFFYNGFFCAVIIFLSFFVFSEKSANAETSKGASLSSDNFRILDPQHAAFGGVSSSSSGNFILLSSIGDIAVGSASITNFGLRSGFLYYPKVTAPTLNSATAGNGQMILSWSAATAFQGFSIAGYNTCYKSSGAYSCSSAGNVTSSTVTGLSNGTSYTFKIQAKDAIGDVIAESNERTGTPVAPTSTSTPAPSGGGGGGGGYSYGGESIPAPVAIPIGNGIVNISGSAYPFSTVLVYIDTRLVSSIKADTNAQFTLKLSAVAAGRHIIGISTTDLNGRQLNASTFNITITENSNISLTNILLAPTISLSTRQLNKGENLRIFGQGAPIAEVNVHVESEERIVKTITDNVGSYAIIFNTTPLEEEDHSTKSRAILSRVVSPFSETLQFIIGKGILRAKTADTNKDNKINIRDLSIVLFWWNTKNDQGLAVADINHDNKVNIVDFSILLFQWTG